MGPRRRADEGGDVMRRLRQVLGAIADCLVILWGVIVDGPRGRREDAMRWIRNVVAILHDRDTEPTELASAALALVWGFVVLLPPMTFTETGAFRYMAVIFGESIWAMGAVVIGTAGLYGIGVNRWRYRWWALLAQSSWWASLTVGAIIGNPYAPAGWFYAMLLVAAAWAWFRVNWHIRMMTRPDEKK